MQQTETHPIRFLPSTRNEEELKDLNEMGKNDFGPTPLDFSWLATDKETDEVMLRIQRAAGKGIFQIKAGGKIGDDILHGGIDVLVVLFGGLILGLMLGHAAAKAFGLGHGHPSLSTKNRYSET